MTIDRPIYLQKLIESRHNHLIKILTGVRRCGKSYLLFTLYTAWLKSQGVDDKHIIRIDLEDRRNVSLRDPDILLAHIDGKMQDDSMYYILIDEIQHVAEFEDVLNSYLKIENADVYVTGSNARFLSKDVITTFRGRGDEIKIYPLCFREFMSVYPGTKEKGLDEYMTYGGMPQLIDYPNDNKKSEYLKALFINTYIRDIKERYTIRDDEMMENLFDVISSSIGSLTNPTKLANTLTSVRHESVNKKTVSTYLEYICDSFLAEKVSRYDVKGRSYFDTPYKYYFVDLGLRNARLNFRQMEPTHIMENMVYNELRVRGYNVDVGVVPIVSRQPDGRQTRSQLEIDFVCNLGSKKYYVQSAYRLPDEEKIRQEEASLRRVDDSFKKIIVLGEDILVRRNEAGITTIGIHDFLLNPDSLDL
ncbi:MAG: ATP-binding protein [Bacteroidaceae bacterium]|nr:ATP-binding protein [Bacteroidaceae bacterium]